MSLTKVTYSMIAGSPINVIDYGVVGDGSTDDTTTLQAAITAGAGGAVYLPEGTYLISDDVVVSSNTTLIGEGNTIIKCATADKSFLSAANATNIVISNIQFQQTTTGTVAYVAGVALDTCTRVTVENCNFVGMQWAGVWLKDSSYCTVNNNRFTAFTGTVQDSADICVYRNSSYNVISNNYCFGGNYHGILVQDPYATSLPLKNVVSGNRVGQHKAYGIGVYQPNSVNTYTQVVDNFIENILGSVLGNSSGAGIYVVGAGGVVVSGNTIRNCCQQTNNRTLTPGAIGINGINVGIAPVVIDGNNIADTNYYDGINVSSSTAGAVVTNNQITINNGNTTGIAIYVNGSNNTIVDGNSITQNNFVGGDCVSVYANDTSIRNITITNNNIVGGNYSQIKISRNSSPYTTTGVVISNNILTGASSSSIPIRIGYALECLVTGNSVRADTQPALYQNDSQVVRYANNWFFTTGTNPIQLAGTNSGSYFDKTNLQYSGSGSAYYALNQGTGAILEIQGNAAPATGTWAVGDAVWQNVPVAGQPKGWRCTVAGTPGTWVSEGNL